MPIVLWIPVALSLLGLKENGFLPVKGVQRFSSSVLHKEGWTPTPKHWVYSQPVHELVAVPFLQEEICPGGLGALWEQQPRAGFPRISALKGNQKCHLCQAPSPWPFTATAQRLQSCWNGFSPNLCEAQTLFSPSHLPFCSFPRRSRLSRPNICSSHLSQLVCASFKSFFLFCFPAVVSFGGHPSPVQLLSLQDSCAGSIPIPSLVCMGMACILLELVLLNSIQLWQGQQHRAGMSGDNFGSGTGERITGFRLRSLLKRAFCVSLFI